MARPTLAKISHRISLLPASPLLDIDFPPLFLEPFFAHLRRRMLVRFFIVLSILVELASPTSTYALSACSGQRFYLKR